MKVGFLITARLKSKRLPQKIIRAIYGKPIISHMVDRIKQSKLVDTIVVCTSTDPQDDPLEEISKENGVECFRGDANDVLKRLADAAQFFDLDYIINITADCPFVDPQYIDLTVDKYKETEADLIRSWDLPHGAFCYGISVRSLGTVLSIKDSSDTEIWVSYFTDTGRFTVLDLDIPNPHHRRPGLRMTLDYPDDLKFFEAVFDALYVEGRVFSLDQILDLLDEQPHLIALNEHCSSLFKKKHAKETSIKLKRLRVVETAFILGCGSIGQRHIRILQELGIGSIFTIRSRKGHHKDLPADIDIVELDDWSTLTNKDIDIGIIANPTSLHLESACRLIPFTKGLLIEKPLSNNLAGVNELTEVMVESKVVPFMGHNLMFHPLVEKTKEYIATVDLGNILSIQCHFGQWLPGWHPYEDYTTAYYARKDLGGGASLSLIHEIHLVTELAGPAFEIYGITSSSNALQLDVDVVSDIMIRHKSGCVSQVHLDFLQRPARRVGTVNFERGSLSYDLLNNLLLAQGPNDSAPVVLWSDHTYDINNMYMKQMKTFIRYVEEQRIHHAYDLRGGVASLAIVDALHASNDEKRIVRISDTRRFSFL